MPYKGKKAAECDVDHFETNECRVDNQIYKLSDICITVQEEVKLSTQELISCDAS